MSIKLYYAEDVAALMEEEQISKGEIEEIVEASEATGERIEESESGWFIGRKNEDDLSYWVYYVPHEEGFKVERLDRHHMVVKNMKK